MRKEIEEDRKRHKAAPRACYPHRLSAFVGCDPCTVAINYRTSLFVAYLKVL